MLGAGGAAAGDRRRARPRGGDRHRRGARRTEAGAAGGRARPGRDRGRLRRPRRGGRRGRRRGQRDAHRDAGRGPAVRPDGAAGRTSSSTTPCTTRRRRRCWSAAIGAWGSVRRRAEHARHQAALAFTIWTGRARADRRHGRAAARGASVTAAAVVVGCTVVGLVVGALLPVLIERVPEKAPVLAGPFPEPARSLRTGTGWLVVLGTARAVRGDRRPLRRRLGAPVLPGARGGAGGPVGDRPAPLPAPQPDRLPARRRHRSLCSGSVRVAEGELGGYGRALVAAAGGLRRVRAAPRRLAPQHGLRRREAVVRARAVPRVPGLGRGGARAVPRVPLRRRRRHRADPHASPHPQGPRAVRPVPRRGNADGDPRRRGTSSTGGRAEEPARGAGHGRRWTLRENPPGLDRGRPVSWAACCAS